jgi:hypothetical protein
VFLGEMEVEVVMRCRGVVSYDETSPKYLKDLSHGDGCLVMDVEVSVPAYDECCRRPRGTSHSFSANHWFSIILHFFLGHS